ncbi:hypothetical protein ABFS83_09G085000 [Erythranthe nasuta]
MAGVSIITPVEVLLSKRVQEMVLSGNGDPSGPYICKKNRNYGEEEEESTENNSPIPFIDIGKLCAKENDQELKKLKLALSTWGCFQAIDHGIPSCFLDKVRGVGREFFGQSMEEKNKCAKKVAEFQGYGADPVPEDGQSLDWSDRIFLALAPEDQRNYTFWPQNPISFKETLEEYTENMKRFTETVSKSMAKSVNLEESCFLKQFGERSQLHGRFNYYSPCKRPDLVLGMKAHSDGSGYTVLLQDETGLQIRYNGKWHTVPNDTNALLVIMGDQMEIMSNGIFTSPVHRVVSDSRRDRISVAVFYTPEVGKEIGPEEGLIDSEKPRLFKTVKDYADIHYGYYQRGMRSLHTVQV